MSFPLHHTTKSSDILAAGSVNLPLSSLSSGYKNSLNLPSVLDHYADWFHVCITACGLYGVYCAIPGSKLELVA